MAQEKVVLAYSGGLDTTAIIPWLKENYGYEVICCCIDCGQGEELDGLSERAKASGAAKLYIEDIVDDFCDNYIVPCVQAGAVYENKYLLLSAMLMAAVNNVITSIIPIYMRDTMDSGLLAGVLDTFCYVGSTMSTALLGYIADRGTWDHVFWCLFLFGAAACVMSWAAVAAKKKTSLG